MKEIYVGQLLCCEEDVVDVSQFSEFEIVWEYSSVREGNENFDNIKRCYQSFRKHLPRFKCVTLFYFFDGFDYVLFKKAISNSLGVLEYEEETGYFLEELIKEEEDAFIK